MSWLSLSLLSAFIWALVNVIDKFVLSKLGIRPIVPLMLMGIVGLAEGLIILGSFGGRELSPSQILLAFAAGFFFVLMAALYFLAVKIEEISRVVPLFYLTPLFILFFAGPFLGEIFTPLAYLGILFLVSGAILLSAKNIFSFKFGKAFYFMILASAFLAINQVITKYLLGFADFWTIFAFIRIGSFLALLPVIFMNLKVLREVYRQKGGGVLFLLFFNEALFLFGLLIFTYATSLGFVTLVNALSSIQPFFVLALSVLLSLFSPRIIKEEIGKKFVFLKAASIAMMFTGALLIGL